MAVVGGAEEVDSPRARRDSKSMSVCGTSDRTADRRSKGVINLFFKSKVRPVGLMQRKVVIQIPEQCWGTHGYFLRKYREARGRRGEFRIKTEKRQSSWPDSV